MAIGLDNCRNLILKRWPIIPLLSFALALPPPYGHAQQTPVPPGPGDSIQVENPPASSREVSALEAKPLPDIPSMMHDVENNQRKAEAIEKDYIYRSVSTEQEVDGHGRVKKTTVTESDHYWIDGVPERRVVKKDGRELTPAELSKENDRADKDAAKARERRGKADAQGKESDADGREEITVSRLLELGSFTNPRRVQLNGRDAIAVDYIGDPKARTRNRSEDVIRDMAGTAWVDEQDHVLARVEGHFVNDYKVGVGLIADVRKDTRFTFEQTKVNGEVWLPARIDAQGSFRALLFVGFNGSVHVADSDYRKFRATATILPGATPVTSPDPQASQR
jgi:hypothetical protein